MIDSWNAKFGVNFRNEKVTKKDLRPKCAYCSMPAEFACDKPGCGLPMCKKHVIRGNGEFCRDHKPLTFKVHSG